MSYPKRRMPGYSRLRNFLTIAFCVCLFGILSLGAGVCQTPGYGDKPDQWAPYESGQHFEQLQKILEIYRLSDSKITYLHFEEIYFGIRPVDLFRIPQRQHADCGESDCYLFALIASNHSNTPLVTPCQFKQAALSHLFNPDGSKFFGFEFSCKHTLLQVKVTPTHLGATSVEKAPLKMESK